MFILFATPGCCKPPVSDAELASVVRKTGKGKGLSKWRCSDCKNEGSSRYSSAQSKSVSSIILHRISCAYASLTDEAIHLDLDIDLTDEPLERHQSVPRVSNQVKNTAKVSGTTQAGPSRSAVEILSLDSDDDIEVLEAPLNPKSVSSQPQPLMNKPTVPANLDNLSNPNDVPLPHRPRKKRLTGQDKELTLVHGLEHEIAERENHLSDEHAPKIKIEALQPPSPMSLHSPRHDEAPTSGPADDDDDVDLVPRLEKLSIRRMTPAPTRTRAAHSMRVPGLTTTQDSAPVPLTDFGLVKLAYDGGLEKSSDTGVVTHTKAILNSKPKGRTKIKARNLDPTSRFALRSTWDFNIAHVSEDEIEELAIVANLHE